MTLGSSYCLEVCLGLPKQHGIMDPFSLVSTVEAGGGGIFSCHTLGLLVSTEHCVSMVVDHVHPFFFNPQCQKS